MGMDGTVVEARLLVRHLHADIEGGYYFSAYFVLAAYVDAAEQLVMIDGETWNLIHIVYNLQFIVYRLSRKALVTLNEPSAIFAQKSKYICALVSFSGTSLMMRKEMNGVL